MEINVMMQYIQKMGIYMLTILPDALWAFGVFLVGIW